MATYKYRQNFFEGSDVGYVQYNITPDFDTVMTVGDWIEITGKVYSRDFKLYGLIFKAASASNASLVELGRIEKVCNKGGSATFSMMAFVTQEFVDTASSRGFEALVRFVLAKDAAFTDFTSTDPEEDQVYPMLQYRIAPEIESVSITDDAVIDVPEEKSLIEFFGGAVQGKSDLSADLTVQLDPFDPSLRITHAEFAFAEADGAYINRIYVQEDGISEGDISGKWELHIGAPAISGAFTDCMLTLTDSKGMRSSYFTGQSFTIYPYEAPKLDSNSGRDLVERYELVKNADNTETPRLAADGIYLWANFIANVTPINGKNEWKILRRHAVYGEELPDFTEAKIYADGKVETFAEDKTIFPISLQFDAGKRYAVEIKISDYFESALLRFVVEKSGGYFNVEKYGVAAGMRSTAKEGDTKLESAYPVYPYEGIKRCENAAYETQLELDSAFRLYSEDSGLRLMAYGNVVHLSGIITPAAAISGSTTQHVIADIPAEFAPKYPVTVLQQGTGTAIWMLRVYPATDSENPAKATFSRYRNGSSYASCAAGNFLPLDAVWIV